MTHRTRRRQILVGAIILFLTVIAAVQVFAKPMRVRGDCMEPAIRDGQWIFVNRSAYWRYTPAAGHIVLFQHEDKIWVSRVVAVGHDRIELTGDGIVVNGRLVADDSIVRDWREWNQHGKYAVTQPLDIPEGHVFVLSDKLAAQHDDSRVFGPIAIDRIMGKSLQ